MAASSRATLVSAAPGGLRFVRDFLSSDTQAELLSALARLDYREVVMRGVAARRTVAHFGLDYGYDSRALTPGTPLPGFLVALRERCAALAFTGAEDLSQILVTRYPVGAGIGWHRDAPMFDRVVGVSLGAECTLRFRRRVPEGFVRYSLALPPGSAYALSGAARRSFQHGIESVSGLRYSITFRTLLRPIDRDMRGPWTSPSA